MSSDSHAGTNLSAEPAHWQFSLRSLFALVAYCAALMAVVVIHAGAGATLALASAGFWLVRAGHRQYVGVPPRYGRLASGRAKFLTQLGLVILGSAPGALWAVYDADGAWMFLLAGPGILGASCLCGVVFPPPGGYEFLFVFAGAFLSHILAAAAFTPRCLQSYEWRTPAAMYFGGCLTITLIFVSLVMATWG